VIGFLKKFERMIVYSLITMMILTVSLTTIELGWIIIKRFLTAGRNLNSERPR
jgi:hypothetical protein